MKRLPFWFKQELPDEKVNYILNLLRELRIDTICVWGRCPNINHCFKEGAITFLLLGRYCSRSCRFCAVSRKKQELEVLSDQPQRIKEIIKRLNLDYLCLTSVCRDDLPDKGSRIFREVIESIKIISKQIKIELLIPDFGADKRLIGYVVDSDVDIVAHNLEVPQPLYKKIKPQGDYHTSLEVLRIVKEINTRLITKSSLIFGLGETREERISAIEDLSRVGIEILTLGQYLAPSRKHYPVREFLSPQDFDFYRDIALRRGIKVVSSGPWVRSSYRARELYYEVLSLNSNLKDG